MRTETGIFLSIGAVILFYVGIYVYGRWRQHRKDQAMLTDLSEEERAALLAERRRRVRRKGLIYLVIGLVLCAGGAATFVSGAGVLWIGGLVAGAPMAIAGAVALIVGRD
jgi:hypothetical protein